MSKEIAIIGGVIALAAIGGSVYVLTKKNKTVGGDKTTGKKDDSGSDDTDGSKGDDSGSKGDDTAFVYPITDTNYTTKQCEKIGLYGRMLLLTGQTQYKPHGEIKIHKHPVQGVIRGSLDIKTVADRLINGEGYFITKSEYEAVESIVDEKRSEIEAMINEHNNSL